MNLGEEKYMSKGDARHFRSTIKEIMMSMGQSNKKRRSH